MDELDPRIVKVGIEIDGLIKTYDGLAITASGIKYANGNQNEAEISIANLDKATRDYILTETSPFNKNRTPKRVILDVGRKSYGTSRIFVGDITASNISQPPDITLTLKALTADFQKGNVLARSEGPQTDLSLIAQNVAADLGLTLDFQAQNRKIANYSFTGGALKQVDKLGEAFGVVAYVDDNQLIVKDLNAPLRGRVRILTLETGMIGVPELTEQGVKVKFLIDNQTTLGSGLQITSVMNPAANGLWTIYKLGFELASRDTPFYYVAEGKKQ
jgi:hypothetical protein